LADKFSNEYEQAGRPEKKKGHEARGSEYQLFLSTITKSVEIPKDRETKTEKFDVKQYYQPLIKVCANSNLTLEMTLWRTLI
jgi:hypothetical protein